MDIVDGAEPTEQQLYGEDTAQEDAHPVEQFQHINMCLSIIQLMHIVFGIWYQLL